MKQEESRQAQMNNYRAFGRRPGNRNMTVEKPQDGKKTLKKTARILCGGEENAGYAYVSSGCCSCMFSICTTASKQCHRCNNTGEWKSLTPILITMVIVYIIHSLCTFYRVS